MTELLRQQYEDTIRKNAELEAELGKVRGILQRVIQRHLPICKEFLSPQMKEGIEALGGMKQLP